MKLYCCLVMGFNTNIFTYRYSYLLNLAHKVEAKVIYCYHFCNVVFITSGIVTLGYDYTILTVVYISLLTF